VLGVPYIWDNLRHEDETCSLNRGTRLMQINGIPSMPTQMALGQEDIGNPSLGSGLSVYQ
jgi:hypothetical protein